MDQLNQRYGRGTLKLASAGAPKAMKLWAMRQHRMSPAYTTDWAGLVITLDAKPSGRVHEGGFA
jgi:DNA polymerase V